jgi:hypothetical protein
MSLADEHRHVSFEVFRSPLPDSRHEMSALPRRTPRSVETAADLQHELARLVLDTRALSLHELETAEASTVFESAAPATAALLDRAIALLTMALARYEAPPLEERIELGGEGGEASFFRKVDSLMSREPATRVADLAFMGRWELESRLERIRQLSPTSAPWNVLAVCGSAQRRIVKAVSALDWSLRQLEGFGGAGIDEGFTTELMVSLRVRRAYASFWRAVSVATPPSEAEVHKRLRLGAVQIAVLVGRRIYPELRILDRMELRKLQSAILEWLRGDKDPRAGLRIWHDLNAFAGLLVQVSRRTELREHDEILLQDIADFLQDRAGDALASGWTELMQRAVWLVGRDSDLDGLIRAKDIDRVGELRTTVQLVLSSLRTQGDPHAPRPTPKDISDIIVLLQERGD